MLLPLSVRPRPPIPSLSLLSVPPLSISLPFCLLSLFISHWFLPLWVCFWFLRTPALSFAFYRCSFYCLWLLEKPSPPIEQIMCRHISFLWISEKEWLLAPSTTNAIKRSAMSLSSPLGALRRFITELSTPFQAPHTVRFVCIFVALMPIAMEKEEDEKYVLNLNGTKQCARAPMRTACAASNSAAATYKQLYNVYNRAGQFVRRP